MAVTLVGSTSSNGTTVTVPAHQVGDIIIIAAFRSSSNVVPTVPATFSSMTSHAGTACAGVIAMRQATATNDASGTWTNATNLVCHVYRGGSMPAPPSQQYGSGFGTSSGFTGPTITNFASTNTSRLGHFALSKGGNPASIPSPMVLTQSPTGGVSAYDSNGTVSTSSGYTYSGEASSGEYIVFSIEIKRIPAPVNTAAPTVSLASGIKRATRGTAAATTGTWSNFPSSYTYQWYRGTATGLGSQIAGATAASHAFTSADAGLHVWCQVRGVNPTGSGNTADSSNDVGPIESDQSMRIVI